MKKRFLVTLAVFYVWSSLSIYAMEEEKQLSSIEELCKKMRDFNVWQEKAKVGPNNIFIFDDYSSRVVPYKSWCLLIDERRKEFEEEIERHKDGETIHRLIRMQNFCWIDPRLFGRNYLLGDDYSTIIFQPKSNKRCSGYYLESTCVYPDAFQTGCLQSPFGDYDEEVFCAKVIPGTKRCVTSSGRAGNYLLKICDPFEPEDSFERTSQTPVSRIAIDTRFVAWTSVDEKSQLRLKIWQAGERGGEEIFNEIIHPGVANFPFALKSAPNPATIMAIGGNQIRLCCYEKKLFSKKLDATKPQTFSIGEEDILDVANIPQKEDFALFTQSHMYLLRFNAAKQLTRNRMIVLPVCPDQFSFSPDGNFLAVAGINQDGQKSDNRNLYAIDLITGQQTENLANHLDLEDQKVEGSAFKVNMLNDGAMHVACERKSKNEQMKSYKGQILLPIDLKVLLVLKAMQQVCLHPLLVHCAQDFGYGRKDRDFSALKALCRTKMEYLDAIQQSATFNQCSKIWQTILKAAISDEQKGLQCSADPKKTDKEFMSEKGRIDYVAIVSGVRHLMKKMASECEQHE